MGIRIPLPDSHFLTSDDSNYIIVEEKTRQSGDNKGEVYDWPVGYYSKLEHALEAAANRHLRGSDATSFDQLLAELRKFEGQLAGLLSVKVSLK